MQQRLLSAAHTFALAAAVFAAGVLPASAQRYDDRYDPGYDQDYAYDPPSRVARISYVSGDVSFAPAGERDWYRSVVNRPLVRGDSLYAGARGLAEFQLGDAAVRIDEHTAVEVLSLDDGYVQVELSEGSLNLFVRRLYRDEVYEIATPTLALVVTEPGSYRIDVDPRGRHTDVLVWDGAAEAYGTRSSFPLREGEAVRFHDPDLRDYDIYRLPQPDAFDRFAFERDNRLRRSESLQYLPEGVIGYSDLDHYGRWDSVRDHGRVWFPRDVQRDWAPYRNGNWIWQEPWGWTWVDAAPWGFAPFHYGRWVHVNSRWGWVPGPRQVRAVYAPALVAFVGGSNWNVGISLGSSSPVGWFPLGPREIYVPPYHASRDYFRRVNVSNTVIQNTTIINNVYNNYYVQGGASREDGLSRLNYRYRGLPSALTAVPGDAFAQGRSVQAARLKVDSVASARGEVRRFAAVAPQKTSLAGSDRARAVPSQATLQRPVIARRAPAAPVVPFEQRAEQLRRNPGQPLARAQVQTLRESTKVAPVRSRAVRVVGEASQRVERATAGSTPAARSLPRGTAARDEAAAARRTDPAVGRAVPARTPQADGAKAPERSARGLPSRSAATPADARSDQRAVPARAAPAAPATVVRDQQRAQEQQRATAAREQLQRQNDSARERQQAAQRSSAARDAASKARAESLRAEQARSEQARSEQARQAEARTRTEQARNRQVQADQERAAQTRAAEARKLQQQRAAPVRQVRPAPAVAQPQPAARGRVQPQRQTVAPAATQRAPAAAPSRGTPQRSVPQRGAAQQRPAAAPAPAKGRAVPSRKAQEAEQEQEEREQRAARGERRR